MPHLRANLSTLSVALNCPTDQGLGSLMAIAPHGVSFDIEGNNIQFTPGRVDSLWQDSWPTPSALPHLNISSNAPDLVGYAHLLWMAGRSSLETFDAAIDMSREGIQAPTRLLLFILSNSSLQRLDVRGTIFGIGMDNGEMNLASRLSRAITNHPSLRARFLDPTHFQTGTQGREPVSP